MRMLFDRRMAAATLMALAALALAPAAQAEAVRSAIVFKALNPIEASGAKRLTIHVRSRYFQPTEGALSESAPLSIEQDGVELLIEPIYLVDRTDGQMVAGKPLFEYRIDAEMPDGAMRQGGAWIASWRLRAPIGASQIAESFGPTP